MCTFAAKQANESVDVLLASSSPTFSAVCESVPLVCRPNPSLPTSLPSHPRVDFKSASELRSGSPPSPPVASSSRDPPSGRPLTMEAMEELSELAESMRQAASLLADDDPSDDAAPRRPTTFLNAVALGNVVSIGPPPFSAH
jgi:hypothetical protein